MNSKNKKIIDSALEYLCISQNKNGSFPSLTSPDSTDFSNATLCSSLFSTPLISLCLNLVEDSTGQKDKIQKKSVKFLLGQKSNNWSFNYWDRNSTEYKKMPYPDDLDDTFCSLAAIYSYNPKLIKGSDFASIVSLLTALETKEGGPYRTWLMPDTAKKVWLDVDLAVNSNIGYFLSLQEISLPGISQIIDRSITKKNFSSPYYPSPYPIIFFISRFYAGPKKQDLINFLLGRQEKNGSWNQNPLDTALAVLSFLNLDAKVSLDSSIDYLTKSQHYDGSWSPHPFYVGINPKGEQHRYFAGSSALTTAFCLTAISQAQKRLEKSSNESANSNIYTEVYREAVRNLTQIISQKDAENFLKSFLTKDTDGQVILFPAYFCQCLKSKSKIKQEFLVELGLASLFGWIAYTVYDDFIDHEEKIEHLPIAIFCLRQLTLIFSRVLPDKIGFSDIFTSVMNGIEKSNSWEIKNCRLEVKNNIVKLPKKLPNFQDLSVLADRSFGHALGPLAILARLEYAKDSAEMSDTIKFIKHFIIARQLLDDAHDWEEDLRKGQLSSVSVQILKLFKKQFPEKNLINLDQDLDLLRKVFWLEIAPKIFNLILNHLKKSRRALFACNEISHPEVLLQLLDRIEVATQKGISDRKKTIEFLEAIEFN